MAETIHVQWTPFFQRTQTVLQAATRWRTGCPRKRQETRFQFPALVHGCLPNFFTRFRTGRSKASLAHRASVLAQTRKQRGRFIASVSHKSASARTCFSYADLSLESAEPNLERENPGFAVQHLGGRSLSRGFVLDPKSRTLQDFQGT